MQLFDFTCSHCGAPLEYSTEIVECRYCGSHFIFDGLQEYAVEEELITVNTKTYFDDDDYFIPYWYNPEKIYSNPCPSLYSDFTTISSNGNPIIYQTFEIVGFKPTIKEPKKQNRFTKFIKRLFRK